MENFICRSCGNREYNRSKGIWACTNCGAMFSDPEKFSISEEELNLIFEEGKENNTSTYDSEEAQKLEYERTGQSKFLCRVCGNKKYKGVGKTYWCTFCGVTFTNPGAFSMKSFKWTKLRDDAVEPKKSHESDTGFDLTSPDEHILKANEVKAIPIGIAIRCPFGYGVQIRPRSGLSKKMIKVANTPGTVDEQYTGEIMVLLHNTSKKQYVVKEGDRIAQMVLERVIPGDLQEVQFLDEGERGANGFNSTGD